MTTKPNSGTVSVSRELIVRLCNFHATGWEDIGPEIQELRATLAEQHIVCSNGILCQSTECAECGGNGSYKSGTQVTQPADQQGEPVAWKFCPECGCEEIRHQEGKHKQCADCHQEWFADIDYSDVIRANLHRLYRHAQPATAKADEQAEALKKAKANTDYDEFDNGVD